MTEPIPFLDLAAQSAEIAEEVLDTWRGQLESAQFVGGPQVASFEDEYAAYIGVAHCIGVGNGTDALELALRAAAVRPGDEVILPVNTFIATAEAVSRIGAVPVFVDCDPVHLLIDRDQVEAAITDRTRAVVPVHLFGQTAPVEDLRGLAALHDLTLVEDAAQSQGASSRAGRAGALGSLAATSFYPGKNLGAGGDAGAVLTDDDDAAHLVRSAAAHGSTTKYVHDRVGFNSRLDAVQATVLRAKLRRLDRWNDARRAIAARYAELLSDVPEVAAPVEREGNQDAWHLYVVAVDDRDRVLRELTADGVGVAIHYPTPLHLTAAYRDRGYRKGDFPVAEAAARRILSLPMYPHLRDDQQRRVVDALARAVRTGGRS